jgi:hypothetical protein
MHTYTQTYRVLGSREAVEIHLTVRGSVSRVCWQGVGGRGMAHRGDTGGATRTGTQR